MELLTSFNDAPPVFKRRTLKVSLSRNSSSSFSSHFGFSACNVDCGAPRRLAAEYAFQLDILQVLHDCEGGFAMESAGTMPSLERQIGFAPNSPSGNRTRLVCAPIGMANSSVTCWPEDLLRNLPGSAPSARVVFCTKSTCSIVIFCSNPANPP